MEALEFAKIVEEEVHVRSELEKVRRELSKLETDQLDAMHRYMSNLRRRYQEEQLWQDKWRIYSTYGTWGLIVLNSIVFMIGQFMVRLRENRQMKEIQDFIRQSRVLTNEGMSRAIRENQDHVGESKHGRQTPNKGCGVQTPMTDPCIDNAAPYEYPTIDEDNDGAETTAVENVSRSSDISKCHKESQQISSIIPSSARGWSTLRRFTNNVVSTKIVQVDQMKVDLPSVVLGASITGIAWLIFTNLFFSKGK